MRLTLFKFYFLALFLSALAFAANSFIHIWANQYHREEITSYNGYLPLYSPFVSSSLGPILSAKFPRLFPPESGESQMENFPSAGGIITYPLEPLSFKKLNSYKNIVIIVLESWQTKTLTDQIMPHLAEFSQGATVFQNHVSSGSSTIPGLFGLFFGIHSSMYDLFKDSPITNPSEFTEALANRGYVLRVFSGNDLNRFQMRKLIFSKVKPENFYQADDESLVDTFIQTLDNNSPDNDEQSPRFDFLFLVSSHSPYNFPVGYDRFQPIPKVKGGFVFNSQTDPVPYLNSYYNCLYFSDYLIGKIIAVLKNKDLYDDSWIILTGDHAEEFNENRQGYWGHGSNFSYFQTSTPMVIKQPGQTEYKTVAERSLHVDLVPTLMAEVLGCQNPVEDYSHGQNIFRLPATRDTVISSYFDQAYLIGDNIIERLKLRCYRWQDMSKCEKQPDEDRRLSQLFSLERRFIANSKTRSAEAD
jgi:membrane-anchored protein YejM (alkaline phosphatase superfamily)